MKTKLYFLAAIVFSFFEMANGQVLAGTPDFVALPTTFNTISCSVNGPSFVPPPNYNAISSAVQLGVNNTGTDICEQFNTNGLRIFQAMVWDNVTLLNPFTSVVYLSCNLNDSPIFSFTFPIPTGERGGFDPDVAIFSDANGTFLQVVFENNTSNRIDGYTFRWNGSTFIPINNLNRKCTLSRDATRKAKNPNIATPKSVGGGIAVVWHEEGSVNPAPVLNISYGTVPPITYSNTVSVLESKVYIYAIDKPGYFTSELLCSPTTGSITNYGGSEVIRSAPSNTIQLFNRNFNPDVSFNDESIGVTNPPVRRIISVVFLSQWFNPATFSIVTDQLSVVQGQRDEFVSPGLLTTTYNFTTQYSGKPRIAARLAANNTGTSRDFSVVMGNTTSIPPPCGGTTQTISNLHNWWFQAGGVVCPTAGVDLLLNTPYATSSVMNPVISCVNARGFYNVAFSAINTAANSFDIVANTYKEGALISTPASFSLVNYGTCVATRLFNQVVPSVASVRKTTSATYDNAISNYLFWDQSARTINFKRTTNTVPGSGVGLRLSQNETFSKFIAYPNPTDNEILFDFKLVENEVPAEIEIFNMIGQSVDKFSIEESSTEQKRDVNKIPSGTYIAILKTSTKDYSLEFIKR